jgi:hypothetical protein
VPPLKEHHVPAAASETPELSTAHRLHASELIATLRTDARQGLGNEDARARLAQYGPNELAAHTAVPAWRKFLSQFQNVLVILLLIATGISAALWVLERDAALPYEAIAIFAVVLLNATMGYVQESRAEAAVAALRAMSAPDAPSTRPYRAPVVPPDPRAQVAFRGHTYAPQGMLESPMLASRRCPVCQEHELRPGQTLCSPRCRTRRWRQARTVGLVEIRSRVAELVSMLDALLKPPPRRG